MTGVQTCALPIFPLPNSPLESQVIRDQLQSLFVLIHSLVTVNTAQVDSTSTLPPGSPANASVSVIGHRLHFSFEIPQGLDGIAGPAGMDGAVGPPFAQAVVDSVTTLNPGDSATVGVSFDGSNVRFNFAIPRGNDGSQGPPGNTGNDGGQGPQGVQGPPFAQALVDGVTTLDPGQPATVQTSFDGSNVRFSFGIPRGNDGQNGTNGTNGSDGINGSNGSDGAPGEVTSAQLSAAISGTSANTNSVSTLGQAADGSYNPQQMQDLMNKVDELINALRR